MNIKLVVLLILHFVHSELQGPPNVDRPKSSTGDVSPQDSEPTSSDRKSSKISESVTNDITTSDEENDNQDVREFTAKLMQFMESPLVQVSKKSDEKLQTRGMAMEKLNTIITNIKESRSKIEKIEPTAEEQDAENLYQTGSVILNQIGGDKIAGYDMLKKASEMGHQLAKSKIAWAHLLGHSVKLDIKYAKGVFEELVQTGLPEAHMALGFMYSTGIGVNVSQSRALVHYTMGALGDDTWSQMALGYRYSFGITIASSCEKALGHYRNVAKKVASRVTFSGGPAVHRIRLLDEVENPGGPENDLVEYYQLLAEKGDVNAQVGLGQLYYQGGRATPQNHKQALEYFTQAANSGNAVAYAFLGKIYLEGSEHINANNETAFLHFKKAAELGNPIGQSGLGIMYLHARGVPKDTTKALNYFTQAADQGWVDGQLQLGNMYFSGNGVKMDFKLAVKYFNLASQSGHVLAYYNLGLMHALGLGMMRSCPTAVEFFKNVAERGRWSEQLMHAYQDYKYYRFDESFMKYALLAEMGYEVGQGNAAFLLDRNEVNVFQDRSEDLIRAFHYWKRAAAQGYSAAQVKLGDYYYYGLGTIVDYETAASLYRKASEQQYNAQAMFNLGYMHEQGLGMKKDWHLAKRLYDLAAETNSDAKVPVALALLKLQLITQLESLKGTQFKFILNLDENIASNWDLYLITILTLLLGIIMYTRRPGQENEAQQQQRPEPEQQEPQQQQQQPPENDADAQNNN